MNHLTSELIHSWLDGELDAPARVTIAAHLAACAQCRRELENLRGVFIALAALPVEPIPVDLAPRVLARIQPNPVATWAKILLAAQVALTAALALWLAPTLAAWAASNLGAPSFDLASRVAEWSRVWNDVAAWNVARDIAPMQWGIVVALAAAVWLVGNRLLLNIPNGAQEAAS